MSNDPALQAALHSGWTSACQLYEYLLAGGEPVELPPTSLRLNDGEVPYADAMVGYARFYGKNVTYQQNNSFFLGSASFVAAGMVGNAIANNSARRKAEAMAAAQWRDQATVHGVLTNRRILTDVRGRWLNFWHNGIVEFQGDLAQWMIVTRYEVGDPLLLHGPVVPWFAVLVGHLVYGRRGLQLPVLAPIAHAVAQHQQAVGSQPQQLIDDADPNQPPALPPGA